MTRVHLAVVSAGLSQPSSTRLLADQLAAATRREPAIAAAGRRWTSSSCASWRTTSPTTCSPASPRPRCGEAIDAGRSRRTRLIAVTPMFSASYSGLFKSFFDVLDPESLVGTAGADGRHRRVRAALAACWTTRCGRCSPTWRTLVVPPAVFAATADFGSDESGRSDWPTGSTGPPPSSRP